MIMSFDISNFSDKLFNKGIELLTCFELFEYDKNNNILIEAKDGDEKRKILGEKKMITASWLSFSTGYELLYKAVLAKYNALYIKKGKVSERLKEFKNCSKTNDINKVYGFVKVAIVKAEKNKYLQDKLEENKIKNLYDFSTGPLGDSKGRISQLLGVFKITKDILENLKNNKINTKKLKNLVNRQFKKQELINELKKRNISDDKIDVILNQAIKVFDDIINDDERYFLENATQTLLDIRRNVDAHTFYGLTVGHSINDDLSNIYLPALNLLLNIYFRK